MDGFIKASPAQQKILTEIVNLKPMEYMVIIADRNGRPDTFIVHKSTKLLISGDFVSPLKINKQNNV